MLYIAQKFKRTIFFTVQTYTNFILIGIMFIAWQNGYASSTYQKNGNFLMILFYMIILYLFVHIYGIRNIGKAKLSNTVLSYFLAIFITNLFAYIQFCLIARSILNFLPIIYLCIKQFCVAFLSSILLYHLYIKLNPPKSYIIIESSNKPSNYSLIRILNKQRQFNIAKTISDIIDINSIYDYINQYEGVCLINVEPNKKQKIVEYCYSKRISIFITPTVSDLLIKTSQKTQISDTPFLVCGDINDRTEFFIVKRFMDILVSIAALVISFPIMVIIAIAIRLEDGAPALFNQQRITIDGRIFKIYKFRTMKHESDKISNHSAVENDSRITSVGAILRKIRLDELPQFFNILKGDMSVVGPRPEHIENEYKYTEKFPSFSLRHKMKAGLTGYAQIYGKYNTTPEDKLILDLFYVQNASIFLDVKLIFTTIKILFSSESTQGFSTEKPTIVEINTNTL